MRRIVANVATRLLLVVLAVWAGMVGLGGAPPQTGQPPLVIRSMAGPDLFVFYCATCHGKGGRGDGPVASTLKTVPPDLTLIAQRHNGVFPRSQVEQFITNDQGRLVSTHGTKEMPVWGPIFQALDPSDARVKVRIANLVDYIQSIQTK
jgi:mono/diheme cytochrome c family protein